MNGDAYRREAGPLEAAPLAAASLEALAVTLRDGRGLVAKRQIAAATSALGLAGTGAVPVGDDCAALPDGEGFSLFAIEGLISAFVAHDPWFAGWCGIMVNVSDVAAMGGWPVAVVDALWAAGEDGAAPMLAGMRAAAAAFGVPIVGGHTNLGADAPQLSVAILGRARRLLTSFDARPGDRVVAAIDLRGRYREPFSNWDAATSAPAGRLRGDIALLPEIAEAGWSVAGKDISQAGLVGTLIMLAECSGVGAEIDPSRVPRPAAAPLPRWLQSFPSFGYLLAVPSARVAEVVAAFAARDIAAADIGAFTATRRVDLIAGATRAPVWDCAESVLTGCGPPAEAADMSETGNA